MRVRLEEETLLDKKRCFTVIRLLFLVILVLAVLGCTRLGYFLAVILGCVQITVYVITARVGYYCKPTCSISCDARSGYSTSMESDVLVSHTGM